MHPVVSVELGKCGAIYLLKGKKLLYVFNSTFIRRLTVHSSVESAHISAGLASY